jgi:uncharacterized protein YbjT (DUF2867 family)
MTHNNSQRLPKALVIGGRGKTGRRVAQRLRSRGLETRIGSRSAELPFDWEDRSTWAAALHDIQAVYLTFQPDLAVPGSADKVGDLARIARDSGATRLVMLSGRGEPEAQHSERAVRESFESATIVRSSWFAQNFSEGYLLDPVMSGEIALPAGLAAEPFIDADDIADIALEALTDDRLQGCLFEVTGPRLMTFADVAEEIMRASGRQVRYQPITPEQFSAALLDEHVPPDVVGLLVELFTVTLDGRNAYVTDGVRRALGRDPRDFTEYAEMAAASGAWGWRPVADRTGGRPS